MAQQPLLQDRQSHLHDLSKPQVYVNAKQPSFLTDGVSQCTAPSEMDSSTGTAVAIVSFTKKLYLRGIPVSDVQQFRSDPKSIHDNGCALFQLLSQRENIDYWENAVYMIGLLGYTQGATDLVEFAAIAFSPEDRPVPPSVYRAKSGVLTSLGLMLYQAPKTEKSLVRSLMRNLMVGLIAPVSKSPYNWKSPYHETVDELQLDLLDSLLRGYGLSGDSDLLEDLNHYKFKWSRIIKDARSEEVFFPAGSNRLVARSKVEVLIQRANLAIDQNRIVSNKGLSGFFSHNK